MFRVIPSDYWRHCNCFGWSLLIGWGTVPVLVDPFWLVEALYLFWVIPSDWWRQCTCFGCFLLIGWGTVPVSGDSFWLVETLYLFRVIPSDWWGRARHPTVPAALLIQCIDAHVWRHWALRFVAKNTHSLCTTEIFALTSISWILFATKWKWNNWQILISSCQKEDDSPRTPLPSTPYATVCLVPAPKAVNFIYYCNGTTRWSKVRTT